MRNRTLAIALAICSSQLGNAQSLGIFFGHSDVGTVLHAGSATYDSAKNAYTLIGSGENMWATADAFQFAWKKISGDVEISADVSFLNSGGNEHKKAVLMLRQSLDSNSVYADVALHGNGLTSLQYRDQKGGTTTEVESNISAPARLRITRVGRYVYISLGQQGSDLHFAAGSVPIPLDGEFYAGIGVCSHDKNATEQATFSNVAIKNVTSNFYTYVSGWATFYDANAGRCGEGLFKVDALAPQESAEVDTPGLRLHCSPSS